MNISQAVARVYAKALVDIGEDQGNLARIVDDIELAQSLGDATTREFFLSPRIPPAEKKKVLDAALADVLDRPVMGLLHTLVDKRREGILDNIADEFEKFRDLREGRIHAHVTSAQPLDDDTRQQLQAKLTQATGKLVTLHEKVDPKILGGLIVKVGDRILDGSIRRRLNHLRNQMIAARE